MLFNSLRFIGLFLPIVVCGFFLFGRIKRANAAVIWLAVASLFFYGYSNFKYLLPILIFSILFNFLAGRMLARRPDHRLLILAIAVDLFLLGYFKYANFFLGSVAAVLPLDVPTLQIALPIGISFFTFTQIAFLVDAFRGEAREYTFSRYALFVTFFPHLIAGPILHHKEMMPQFEDRRTYQFNPSMFTLGLSWFAAGLFKKVVLADAISSYVAPAFDVTHNAIGFADAWIGTISFALQLYFDFSGYSDMAVGLALLFGIRLPLNFDSPYQAVSMINFWRRWHMTLSRFLRDYLYIPLGGNRKGRARRYLNLVITMLLGGLWHGASWNFIIWGAIHGGALAINHVWRDWIGTKASVSLPSALSRVLTLLVIVLAWVPFRSQTFDQTLTIWRSMMGLGATGFSSPMVSDSACIYLIVALSFISLFLPNTQAIFGWTPEARGLLFRRLTWNPRWTWAAIMGMAFGCAIGAIFMGSVSEFLYFRF